ncbi:MAG: ABC transporter permease DevC [Pirellulaceae bacterium]|nr:ABC transporter permease DevC [Pirellulaceae bacterium]
MGQRLSLAWKQLVFERMKLATAIAGVMVAVMLMWVQLGILAALYDSATTVHRSLHADLVVLSPLSETLNQIKPFSVRTLYRVRGHADVTAVGELLVGPVQWRNPEDGEQNQIQCYGIDPEAGWLRLPGVAEYARKLREDDTFLFDQRSRNVFGPVVAAVQAGRKFEVEVNQRKARAVGLTKVAASFGQQGNILTNRANFLRTHPGHPPEQVHLGLVRLAPGANVQGVKASLQRELAPEALVMTLAEFTELELRFWKSNAPVGFVFTMGTIVGFFIGFIVVYQILYTDVTNHLPHYATMKAIGFADGLVLRLVVRQGLILAILGYIPGSLLAIAFYQVVQWGTSIVVTPTWERAWWLLGLTCLMCLMSGAMATRKLRSADPADVV